MLCEKVFSLNARLIIYHVLKKCKHFFKKILFFLLPTILPFIFRPPKPIPEEILNVQDAYLQAMLEEKGIVSLSGMTPLQQGIYLWKGDITRISSDAIVNPANSTMLGCFIPCHGCINNAIHSAAGIQLRLECSRIMEQQAKPETAGRAKITAAYNLPCRYILHTVGPLKCRKVSEKDCRLLASSYRSCLEIATARHLKSIAFCCISKGEFHFPSERAAEIAIQTVQDFIKQNKNNPEVIFNVFEDNDFGIYKRLLQ